MKRRLTKLVVFLLLGAILNVAVAWGCELSADSTHSGGKETLDQHEVRWPGYLDDANWAAPALVSRYLVDGAGITYIEISSFPGSYEERRRLSKDELFLLGVITCGWPLRSLEVHGHFILGPNRDARMEETLDRAGWYTGLVPPAIVPVRGPRDPHRLPVVPIPGAFVLNTVFYAATLWMITLGPFTARRMIRRKRGRCVKCGYDIRGEFESGCSECGLGRES